jgi:acetyl-CoA carboxylase carboxyl transferase subunit beta
MIDMVVHRHELRDALIRILKLILQPNPSAEVVPLPRPGLDVPPAGAAAGPAPN